MTAQDLKNSILQLAVEGKLLSEKEVLEALESTEGPKTGAELLEQIKAEKARLIAEGKIKKDKVGGKATSSSFASKTRQKELPPIAEDEKPFDIPENWCWCRLGNVAEIARGGSPRPINAFLTEAENGLNWIKIGDTDKGGKYINSTKQKIRPEGLHKTRLIHPGDFLLTNSMSFGRPYISNVEGCIHDGWLVISPTKNIFEKDFLYYLLSSKFVYYQFAESAAGAVVQNLNSDKVRETLIPLPPLAEQKAIVAKIEELLPYIQKYDAAHTKLEEFNKKFPVDMQKSILQQAIMGKLTEDWRNEQASLAKTNSAGQLADCSSAKDLLEKIKTEKVRLIAEGKIKKDTTKAGASGRALAEITEDEIPFDIPESWCWCRLGDICFDIKRGKSPKYVEKSNYLAFAQKCNVKTGGINLEIALYLDESTISRYSNTDCLVQGDVVINSTGGGTMGRVGYFECEIPKGIKGIYPDSHVTTIRTVGFMEQKFVFYFLKTKQKELESLGEGSTNQTELKPYTLQNLLLPLPPLAEQKAIVAKIEELLPLCKKLVK